MFAFSGHFFILGHPRVPLQDSYLARVTFAMVLYIRAKFDRNQFSSFRVYKEQVDRQRYKTFNDRQIYIQGRHKVRNSFVENCIFLIYGMLFCYIDVCYLLQNYVLKISFNCSRNLY